MISGAPGDSELAAQRRHLLAFQQAGYESEAFIHRLTLVPGHLGGLPQMRRCVNHVLGIICKLSVDKLVPASFTTRFPRHPAASLRPVSPHLVPLADRRRRETVIDGSQEPTMLRQVCPVEASFRISDRPSLTV